MKVERIEATMRVEEWELTDRNGKEGHLEGWLGSSPARVGRTEAMGEGRSGSSPTRIGRKDTMGGREGMGAHRQSGGCDGRLIATKREKGKMNN